MTLRLWRTSTRCEDCRIHRRVTRNLRCDIRLSPQICEFIPGRVAETLVPLKRSKCPNEVASVRLLSTSRGAIPEEKGDHMRKPISTRKWPSYLYLLQMSRCDSCLAKASLKVQRGAFAHGATRIGHSARCTSRDDGGTFFLHPLEVTSWSLRCCRRS